MYEKNQSLFVVCNLLAALYLILYTHRVPIILMSESRSTNVQLLLSCKAWTSSSLPEARRDDSKPLSKNVVQQLTQLENMDMKKKRHYTLKALFLRNVSDKVRKNIIEQHFFTTCL